MKTWLHPKTLSFLASLKCLTTETNIWANPSLKTHYTTSYNCFGTTLNLHSRLWNTHFNESTAKNTKHHKTYKTSHNQQKHTTNILDHKIPSITTIPQNHTQTPKQDVGIPHPQAPPNPQNSKPPASWATFAGCEMVQVSSERKVRDLERRLDQLKTEAPGRSGLARRWRVVSGSGFGWCKWDSILVVFLCFLTTNPSWRTIFGMVLNHQAVVV